MHDDSPHALPGPDQVHNNSEPT
ncbi:hypothetical protein EMIT0P228_70188 [Pseudomonas brassicacearum]